MSSWLSNPASSHQAQLAMTAIVSGAVVAGGIFGFQALRRRVNVENLKASIPDIGSEHLAEKLTEFGTASHTPVMSKEDERSAALALRAQQGDYDDDLILEQLARNRVFLTDPGIAKLRASFIIIVGCGGVGSHAAAALSRSGVSKIRLIDFDQVTLSSLNRHALATLADVGTPKVHCIRKRLAQVTPWVHFDCRNELFHERSAEQQLGSWGVEKPDFIIDAIDNIDSKVALLNYCFKNSLKVVSSMGAGCKSDPSRIFLGDISSTIEDPLSRSTRQRLRRLGVKEGLPVVFSTEKPAPGKAQLMPLPEDEFAKGGVGELGVLPDFRVRILPVLGTMPAIFGLTIANHVILEVTGYPHEYISGRNRDKMYESVMAALHASEEKLAFAAGKDALGLKIPITKDDVGFVIEEIFKGRSAVSGLPTRLALVRWRAPNKETFFQTTSDDQKQSRLALTDLVCMTKVEAVAHEREVLIGGKSPEDVYDASVVKLVEARIKEEMNLERYR